MWSKTSSWSKALCAVAGMWRAYKCLGNAISGEGLGCSRHLGISSKGRVYGRHRINGEEHREKQDCCRVFRRGGSFICAGDLLLLCLHSPIRQGGVIIIPAVPTDLGSLPTAIQRHQH